jgi:transposase
VAAAEGVLRGEVRNYGRIANTPAACPCCCGKLAKPSEDITETREVVPRQWKVVRTIREKFTQPAAPFDARAGASLLAMILYGKSFHSRLNNLSLLVTTSCIASLDLRRS